MALAARAPRGPQAARRAVARRFAMARPQCRHRRVGQGIAARRPAARLRRRAELLDRRRRGRRCAAFRPGQRGRRHRAHAWRPQHRAGRSAGRWPRRHVGAVAHRTRPRRAGAAGRAMAPCGRGVACGGCRRWRGQVARPAGPLHAAQPDGEAAALRAAARAAPLAGQPAATVPVDTRWRQPAAQAGVGRWPAHRGGADR